MNSVKARNIIKTKIKFEKDKIITVILMLFECLLGTNLYDILS